MVARGVNKYKIIISLLVGFHIICSSKLFALHSEQSEIVIENKDMRFILYDNGRPKSLIHKDTEQECLDLDNTEKSIFALIEYRPYATELMLTYSAKPRKYYADRVKKDGNKLIVQFEEILYTATVDLNITDYYIGFTLEKLEYTIGKIGVEKRKTEVDEFTLLQLPIKKRSHFGEWLNVAWDDDISVNVLATDPYAKIDAFINGNTCLMVAGMENSIKLVGVGAALITTNTSKLLSCISRLEEDYNLPLGVKSRLSNEYKYSYYEPKGITPKNVDEHIAYAKKGGFRQMLLYYEDIFVSMGHFIWNDQYINKIHDLRQIVQKIEEAGIIPGFHIHYNKASKNDPYVTPIPDPRLNLTKIFTLACPVNKDDSIIIVEESPRECALEGGRRLLKIGNEIISYENYTTSYPYQFTGCKRGELGTEIAAAAEGLKFGLLDVDTWPKFIRFDQKTSIQQEVAKRVSEIYSEAGFKFVYFDGAEDVHFPYWYNVPKAQLEVYKNLNPIPIFSEGATKSHFSWHIITRGNAFDVFPPQDVKEATDMYQVQAARYMNESFSSMNFGWNDYLAPSNNTIGMQPDMYEYICSRAAAWDCPIGLFGRLDQFKKHPRTEDNFRVMRMWEEVRIGGLMTDEQKHELRNSNQEHFLFKNVDGKYEIIPYKRVQSVTKNSDSIRAFIFSRAGKTWVVLWHTRGEELLRIPVSKKNIALYDMNVIKSKLHEGSNNYSTISVGNCRYVVFDLSEEEVVNLLSKSEVV
ncbi:hypothetical protein D7D25_05665 [Proteiniphilum sp. X52]|nr:hypothetical protein D7D25_05665 [Proteiniphilum sp. X52]